MSKIKHEPPRRVEDQLSSEDFWAVPRHQELFGKLLGFSDKPTSGNNLAIFAALDSNWTPSPIELAADQLRVAGFRSLIAAAAEKNSAEAFKEVMAILLRAIRVRPPRGVFTPTVRPPGRPSASSTHAIHKEWVRIGKPAVEKRTLESLAKHFYPQEWQARTARKRLCDRVRAAIFRVELAATKSKAIS